MSLVWLGPLGEDMPDPMCRQIAADLRQKIESGDLGHGAQLPLELRDHYDASRNTIRDALKWLIARGLVDTRPGQRAFIVKKIDPLVTALSLESDPGADERSAFYASEAAAQRRTAKVWAPRTETHQANAVVASEIQQAEDTQVGGRHEQRFIDDIPWSMQTSFYPMRFAKPAATGLPWAHDMPDGAIRYLENVLGIKQALAQQDHTPISGHDRAAFLVLPDDGRVAVTEIHRAAYDETGKPIRLRVTTYPAEINQFAIEDDSFSETIDRDLASSHISAGREGSHA
jgi:GntR family transcriptional regulator